jgi:hypothetical protein
VLLNTDLDDVSKVSALGVMIRMARMANAKELPLCWCKTTSIVKSMKGKIDKA